ncbi:accessory Sec system glycosylation chaperone GtfB [Lactococcus garvieae]|nr:accessory Sec system glycosylation chaperone GtfB [Lactococcus garvieae]
MIRIYDWLNQEALDLHYSLQAAGIMGETIVLNDEGNLPEDITSPYRYFCNATSDTGKALYFNQLTVPEGWQITGNNTEGEVWSYGVKKATIHYHMPLYLRLIKQVDWLTLDGKVYVTDHYNQYGWCFAKTYFDGNQQVVLKKYFTKQGHEVISHNLVTGDVLLSWQGKDYHFTRLVDFILFYLAEAGYNLSNIWYNSLGLPFLASYYYQGEGVDTLFWQEDVGEAIPGNMKLILEGNAGRTKRVVVQQKTVYEKLLRLASAEEAEKIAYLGYIYPNIRTNHNRKQALILTNSDQIEGLDNLLRNLQDYHIHIAALTEMSQHLIDYESFQQVTLYPNVSQKMVDQLFEACDVYLDINHGGEILSASRRAYESDLLILGFDNTVHQRQFMSADHIFKAQEPEQMVDFLRQCQDLPRAVTKQRSDAGQSTPEDYHQILGGY